MRDCYGYDPETQNLFLWDGEFHCLDKTDNPPKESIVAIPGERETNILSACHFMSGYKRSVAFFCSRGNDKFFARGIPLGGIETWKRCDKQDVRQSMPLCVCGDIADDPVALSELCAEYPCAQVYVCGLQDQLVAFGVLARHVCRERSQYPRRMMVSSPNTAVLPGESVEFDEKLDGDGLGRMAHAVSCGARVLNQMTSVCGVSHFYGKTLMSEKPETGNAVCVMRRGFAEKCFPCEPLSAREYAASYVPTSVRNTELFREFSGFNGELVTVAVSSSYVPDLPEYLRFHTLMAKKPYVWVVEPSVDFVARKNPVFRYNRGYMLEAEQYRDLICLNRSTTNANSLPS